MNILSLSSNCSTSFARSFPQMVLIIDACAEFLSDAFLWSNILTIWCHASNPQWPCTCFTFRRGSLLVLLSRSLRLPPCCNPPTSCCCRFCLRLSQKIVYFLSLTMLASSSATRQCSFETHLFRCLNLWESSHSPRAVLWVPSNVTRSGALRRQCRSAGLSCCSSLPRAHF